MTTWPYSPPQPRQGTCLATSPPLQTPKPHESPGKAKPYLVKILQGAPRSRTHCIIFTYGRPLWELLVKFSQYRYVNVGVCRSLGTGRRYVLGLYALLPWIKPSIPRSPKDSLLGVAEKPTRDSLESQQALYKPRYALAWGKGPFEVSICRPIGRMRDTLETLTCTFQTWKTRKKLSH